MQWKTSALMLVLLCAPGAVGVVNAPETVFVADWPVHVTAPVEIVDVRLYVNDSLELEVLDVGSTGVQMRLSPEVDGFWAWRVEADLVDNSTQIDAGFVQVVGPNTFLRFLPQALSDELALLRVSGAAAESAALDAVSAVENLTLPTDFATRQQIQTLSGRLTTDFTNVQSALSAHDEGAVEASSGIEGSISKVSLAVWIPLLLSLAASGFVLWMMRDLRTEALHQKILLASLAKRVGVTVEDVQDGEVTEDVPDEAVAMALGSAKGESLGAA